MLALALVAASLAGGQAAVAQSFTCNLGKQPACLDYSDKVCSSFAKCVSSDAICFNSYTCDYKGFVCKSDLLDIAEKHDDLVNDYNDLAGRYDELLRKAKSLASDYDDLVSNRNALASNLEDVKRCVSYADTIEEAQDCF